ncbi:uncharacterized protein LOC125373030 [Haliotis rufescens]|uniref:uncharacterized protein LOC125373030 n=1 Tax=Haliotis rufescens TaxID=6454 RepID=UPI00201F6AD8|nr:uncharacterized protein LOC125373030 [Haliotis rufescens]
MSEDDLAKELEQQSVTAVRRFTFKKDGVVQPTNTYLFTFARTSIPQSIKANYCNIGVEVYIPFQLRYYTCQAFGHGCKSCHASAVCYRCGDNHEATDCRKDVKCSNCGGNHMASSKSCPVWKRESQIMRIKTEQNVSYYEAKKRVEGLTTNTSTISRPPVTTASIDCQTGLTWVKSVQPLSTASIQKPALPPSSVTPPKPKIVKHVESQTPKITPEPEPFKLTNREKKLLKKKQLREHQRPPLL